MEIKERHPALQTFIDRMHEIVDQGGDEQTVTQAVAQALQELLKHKNIIPPAMMQPDEHRYVMYPVYVAPDESFSIASAVWGVNQTTPIHDHGTWGVIGIVQGIEHELSYQPNEVGKPMILLEEKLIHEGEVVICCTSDQDTHKVSCASEIPCVGLHVYGGNIGKIERRTYDPDTSQVKTFISRWEEVKLN